MTETTAAPPIMELVNLERTFKVGRDTVYAVDGVSLVINDGEVVCLVGESGCGKTTTGKMAVGLLRPTGGEVRYRGKDIWKMAPDEFQKYRKAVQIIHQDPYSSLNPTQTIADIVTAPLMRHGAARNRVEARQQAARLLTTVDLTPPEDLLDKYPHQLSGGQRQRVSVARALTVHPSFIMADEAVSMLDVSIRVSLLKMLSRFRQEMGMTYLFITHDLAVARYFAWDGRIAVMYLGRVVEIGPTPCLIHHPQHPYTKALLSAIPEADPVLTRQRERVPLRSMDVPSLVKLPAGCSFHPRCPLFVPGLCDAEVPQLTEITIDDTQGVGAVHEPRGAVGAIHESQGDVGAIHESPLQETCATLQIACHVVAAQQSRNGDAPVSREELERRYGPKQEPQQ